MWRVLATNGCGSAIVEAALTLAGIAYAREEFDYSDPEDRAKLAALNPLVQVPTVVLPDGGVMTESAAIVLYIDELVPAAQLLPPAGDPARREALRWLVFLVAAIYPTFTYGDAPSTWGCGDELRRSTEARCQQLWRQVDHAAQAPWFLGARRSILDVYICVMTRWRPRRAWFAAECPRLSAIATGLDREPTLARVWTTNFDLP